MRMRTLLLALTVSGFAIACGYLVIELEAERHRLRAAHAELAELRARDVKLRVLAGRASTAVVEAIATSADKHATPKDPKTGTDNRARIVEARAEEPDPKWEEANRRMRADPKVTALVQTTTRAALRANNPEIGRYLGLDVLEEDALLDLLARQEVERQRMNDGVKSQDGQRAYARKVDEQRAELASYLGPEKFQRYQSYQQVVPELQQLAEFRSRTAQLDALTEYQMTELTTVMHKERSRYVDELNKQEWFGSIHGAYPAVVGIADGDPVEVAQAAERKVAMSEDFYDQVQQRASVILTPIQMERFDQMVDEWLTQERLRLQWLRARSEVQLSEAANP
jgi:hypothetical protein